MKRVLTLTVLAFLLFTAMRTDDPRPLGIRVEVGPSSRDPIQLLRRPTPYTYTARALVTHPTEQYVYAAAEVIVAPGERQTVTKKGDDMDVTFTVAVSEKRDRAKTEVVVKRGERILHVQNSDIALAAPEPFAPRRRER